MPTSAMNPPTMSHEPGRTGARGGVRAGGAEQGTGHRVQLFYAIVFTAGLILAVVGAAGALLWAPLLWCAAAGFILITVSFTIRVGRF